eukprot:gene6153-biopygen1103
MRQRNRSGSPACVLQASNATGFGGSGCTLQEPAFGDELAQRTPPFHAERVRGCAVVDKGDVGRHRPLAEPVEARRVAEQGREITAARSVPEARIADGTSRERSFLCSVFSASFPD